MKFINPVWQVTLLGALALWVSLDYTWIVPAVLLAVIWVVELLPTR